MDLPTSSPSAQGIDPAGVLRFVEALQRDPGIEPHGLIVQRHGHRILEAYWSPHRAGQLRHVYSLSKTFTGTVLGLQLGEGRLTLDDLAEDHLGDLMGDADERTRRMRVRHLASMSSGHDREMLPDALVADRADPVRAFFRLPPPHEPGTAFAYNQPPVLALATLLQRLAGERLVDYLRPRLVEPLGIADLRWHQHRSGVDLGFAGVFVDLDGAARLGQLYLDDGVWDGRRILPEGWVAEASSVQTPNPGEPEVDWQQGYGFQLWMCQHGYRGDGAFGQYLIVLPEQDAVVTFFSNTERMQVVLDHLWTHLLPAFGDQTSRPTQADEDLATAAGALRLATPAERSPGSDPSLARLPTGTFGRTPDGPSHSTITSIEVTPGALRIHEKDGVVLVPLAAGWTDVDGLPMAASAVVDRGGRLLVDLVLLATPHRLEITVDPERATFAARWPLLPLFGMGTGPALHRMVPPVR